MKSYRNGYVFIEDSNGNKNLFELVDKSRDGAGFFAFLVPLSWVKQKHLKDPVFKRIMWIPKGIDVSLLKAYLPIEVYCALLERFGGCDIDCVALKKNPVKIRRVISTVNTKRGRPVAFVKQNVLKSINPENWIVNNIQKSKRLNYKMAADMYKLFHFEKGEWKNDTIRVEKLSTS